MIGRGSASDRPPPRATRPTRRRFVHATLRSVAVAVCISVCGGAGCGASDGDAASTGGPGTDARTGFVEIGRAAGVDFHMTFLETEQGLDFKVNLYDHGSGVAVADIDGDGFDDIYLLNQLGPNGLFRSRGDGTFENVAAAAGVELPDRICTSACFADYDEDGDQDLYVGSTRGGNVLFRNDGSGVFEDVTRAAGVELVAHTQGATFLDHDLDGDLDLFVTNTAQWTLDQRAGDGQYYLGPRGLFELVWSDPEPNVLYRNEGNGRFVDGTADAGLAGKGWGGDVAAFDFDEDGDTDLFVTNMFGRSALYRNDDGVFVDVTATAMPRTSWGTIGCKPLDFDGDGKLDLFLADMHSDMWMPPDLDPELIEPAVKYSGPEGPMVEWGRMSQRDATAMRERVGADGKEGLYGNTVLRNRGDGRFDEVSDAIGAETFWPWGVAAADFDLDGFEDVFLPSGMGFPYFYWPNVLLMNEGGMRFVHRERELGIEPRPDGPTLDVEMAGRSPPRSSRTAAILDIEGDGRPDLVVNNFNERPYLYRNAFPARRWVAFRLQGTRSNRDAIGAAVHVTAGGRSQVRHVLSGGGYLAQSTRTLYFGLAEADTVERCRIVWPGGREQVLTGLDVDRLHAVIEPE